MTTKLSKLVLICGLATATLGATNVMAKGGMEHHHGDRQARFLLSERGVEKLALTQAQQDQLKVIFDANKAKREAKRSGNKDDFKAARKAHKEKMAVLLSAAKFDENAAQELLDARTEKGNSIAMEKLKTQHQIWQVLNEEQREKLSEMKKHKRKKGHNKSR